MADYEKAVRDAALALKSAISEAEAAGYRIEWPGNAAALDTMAISETAALQQPASPPVAAASVRPPPLATARSSDQ